MIPPNVALDGPRVSRWAVGSLLLAAVAVSAFDYGVRRDAALQQVAFEVHRAMVDHTASSPHRYRVLVPMLLQPVVQAAERWTAPDLAFRRVYDVYYLAAFAAMLLALYAFLRRWYPQAEALVGPLLVAATLPIALRNNYFEPASFLEPTLLTLALSWTCDGRHWRIVPLTAVASLSRETAVFIPVACWFAVNGWSLRSFNRTATAAALTATAASAAIFASLRWWLGAAPHIPLSDVWAINVGWEGSHAALTNVTLFLGGTGWLLAAAGFRRAPAFIRRASRVVPFYLAAVAVWGVWYEVRLLMTLYPVLVPCVVAGLFGEPRRDR